ncbi:MAG: carbohydrate kinase family protein [bacterium]|nr:carbohydrate kinase family protein [bacterium]
MHDFITLGSATRDVFFKAGDFELRPHEHDAPQMEQCVPLGSKLEMKEIVFATGGGGANAAVTFARQGWQTAALGVVGADFNGEAIIAELAQEGIETKYFQKHEGDHTAYSVILVHGSGERTILSYKGEGQHFNVQAIPFENLTPKWFYLNSLGGNWDLLQAISAHAAANQIKIGMNPGGKEIAHGLKKLTPVLKNISVLITNKEEGAEMIGTPGLEHRQVLDKLKEVVGGIAVVTDGPNGVLVKDVDGKIYKAGVPDSPVVERTGAGDAWSSGFISEYSRGGDISKAIQFGTANASAVVTQFGARAGILKKDDWGSWPLVEVEILTS